MDLANASKPGSPPAQPTFPAIEMIPKASSLKISTGDLLDCVDNLIPYASGTEESLSQLQRVTQHWLSKQTEDTLGALQYSRELEIGYGNCTTPTQLVQRSNPYLIAKVFVQNKFANLNEAIDSVLEDSRAESVDLMVLAFRNQRIYPRVDPADSIGKRPTASAVRLGLSPLANLGVTGGDAPQPFPDDLIIQKWQEAQALLSSRKVSHLGCADLPIPLLENFEASGLAMPILYQLSKQACFEGNPPKELTSYAEAHEIEFRVHEDSEDPISESALTEQLLGQLSERDRALWRVQWLARWTRFEESSGVVKGRGYILRALRNVKALHKRWT